MQNSKYFHTQTIFIYLRDNSKFSTIAKVNESHLEVRLLQSQSF